MKTWITTIAPWTISASIDSAVTEVRSQYVTVLGCAFAAECSLQMSKLSGTSAFLSKLRTGRQGRTR